MLVTLRSKPSRRSHTSVEGPQDDDEILVRQENEHNSWNIKIKLTYKMMMAAEKRYKCPYMSIRILTTFTHITSTNARTRHVVG